MAIKNNIEKGRIASTRKYLVKIGERIKKKTSCPSVNGLRIIKASKKKVARTDSLCNELEQLLERKEYLEDQILKNCCDLYICCIQIE